MHVHTRQFANMVKRLAWGRKEEKDKNQIISPLDLTRAVQAVQWQQPQKADSLSFWSVCVSVCLCVCVSVCLCVCVSVCRQTGLNAHLESSLLAASGCGDRITGKRGGNLWRPSQNSLNSELLGNNQKITCRVSRREFHLETDHYLEHMLTGNHSTWTKSLSLR